MPARPVGITTDRTVRQTGTPSDSDASRSVPGTIFRISSVVRMITGTMITASETAAREGVELLERQDEEREHEDPDQDRRDADHHVGGEPDRPAPSGGC